MDFGIFPSLAKKVADEGWQKKIGKRERVSRQEAVGRASNKW